MVGMDAGSDGFIDYRKFIKTLVQETPDHPRMLETELRRRAEGGTGAREQYGDSPIWVVRQRAGTEDHMRRLCFLSCVLRPSGVFASADPDAATIAGYDDGAAEAHRGIFSGYVSRRPARRRGAWCWLWRRL